MTSAGTGEITVKPVTASKAIQLGAGAADGAGTLGLDNTELGTLQGSNGLIIGSGSQTGDITVVGAGGPGVSGGTIQLLTSGQVEFDGTFNAASDLTVNATAGNITFGLTGAISAGTNAVTLSAAAGSIEGDVASLINVTAGTLSATASAGIGNANALETAVGIFTFSNATSAVQVTNANAAGFAASGSNTGTGAVTITETAGNLAFGATSVGGDLTAVATAGAISQTDALTVGGNASFTASIADRAITLDTSTNAIGGRVALSTTGAAGHAGIKESGGITFAASSVGGNLTAIAATGDITTSGSLTVGGDATFNLSAAGASLDLPAGNTFSGALIIGYHPSGLFNVTLQDSTALAIPDLVVTGNLTVFSDGSITQTTGPLTVSGQARFQTFMNNDSITLDGAGGINAFNGTVVVNTTGAAGHATVTGAALPFGTSSVGGNLTATAEAGNITQTGALTVAGDATFNLSTAGTSLLLDHAGNTFTGAFTVGYPVAGLGNVTVVDTTALAVPDLVVTGDLVVTAGGPISQITGPLTVGGAASFITNAADQAITLDGAGGDNAFNGTVVVNTTGAAGHATVTGAALPFGTSSVGGNLTATAEAGNITQTGALTVAGDATFVASTAGSSITLGDLANTFTGALAFNPGPGLANLTIADTTAVDIPALALTGDLAVTAGGPITQSGRVTVDGATSLTTSVSDQAITLALSGGAGSTNIFAGPLTLHTTGAAGHAAVTAEALTFAASSVGGNLTATAEAGNITQTGALTVTGTANINAGANAITLNAANDFTGAVSLNNTGANNVAVTDSDDLVLGASTVGQNLTVSAGGPITQAGGITGALLTTSSVGGTTLDGANALTGFNAMNTGTGDITLNNTTNPLNVTGVTNSVAGGAITITSASALTISGPVAAAGTGAVSLTASTGDVTIVDGATAAGTIASASGSLTVEATTGSILDATPGADSGNPHLKTTGSVTLKATAGSIGSGADPADIDVVGTSNLVLQSLNGGTVAGDTTLTALALNLDPTGGVNYTVTSGSTTIAIGEDGSDNLQINTVTSGGSNFDFSLATPSGDIVLPDGAISGIGSGSVTLNAAAGSILDFTGTSITTGGTLVLSATGGIGTGGNPLNTAAGTLQFGGTPTGVFIQNSGALTVSGTTIATSGGGVNIRASSPLTVDADVTDTGGGDITLTSVNDGGLDDHLTINARVLASGGDGNISLSAGTDLIINNTLVGANPRISTAGAGTITATAARDVHVNADVTVQSANGAISLTATGQLSLSGSVTTTGGPSIALTGVGVTQAAASTVNAGAGTLLVDGQGGAIDLTTGTLTTTNA
ncbi:MAG: hypothetical protein WC713_08895, partial [Candidatus Methylomirabilota bacterium]